jgi:rifampin ADP-ribosylating transferase
MVASRSARERKAAAQAGPLARVKIDLDGEQQFLYRISCTTCVTRGDRSWSTHRAGDDNGFMAAMDRWIFHLLEKHPGEDAPCLAFRVEAEQRLHERRGGGPFFHGTKADLRVGDLLVSGRRSNYRPEIVMNHIYFTALPDGAGLAAELAAGEGAPRVYVVEPTGDFEDDPNVTDKKFPGNPTRSYRSTHPLRVVGEKTDWTRLTPEALQAWRDRLAQMVAEDRAEIVN